MAYARTVSVPHDLARAPAAASKRPGLFRRLVDALVEARTRQAEREIARYLGGSDAKFTDEAEREIEHRFLSTSSYR
jgi:hypothetical protein